MWRGVPRREVLIAVGDQRCERVHMVRVLYHRDLIRLARKREGRGWEEKEEAVVNTRLGWGRNTPAPLIQLRVHHNPQANSQNSVVCN